MSSDASISKQAYAYLAELIYRYSRIHLGEHKQQLLTSRLRKRRVELRLKDFDAYCEVLRARKNDDEIAFIVDAISTNHTHFFRERAHFDFLMQHALPELNRRIAGSKEPIRCWSAASSSGEEVYTIAICFAEYERLHKPLKWEILGSDISYRMLDKAQAAVYEQSRLELPSAELLKRYFQKGSGKFEGSCRVKETLRKKVTMKRVNLFDTSYPISAEQHLIFCRNVLIYFDKPSQSELIRKLSLQLAPGGYLFIGHSESLMGIEHQLRPLGHGIFMRAK
jgi:chemotaxis protein methyltransferase CheR